jgi:hypothetical protein
MARTGTTLHFIIQLYSLSNSYFNFLLNIFVDKPLHKSLIADPMGKAGPSHPNVLQKAQIANLVLNALAIPFHRTLALIRLNASDIERGLALQLGGQLGH